MRISSGLLKAIAVLVFLQVACTGLFALHTRAPYRRPRAKRHVRVRYLAWSPVLRGSHESMLRQNELIDRLQLPRIANDDELVSLELQEMLVPVTETPALRLAQHLDATRRYCRSWTRQFLIDISEAYYQEFGKPLWVTSLVRTVEQQHRLRRHNRNAAPAEGDITSSHLAGVAVDIGKGPMTLRERQWINRYVLPLQQEGLVEAAEERRQACYHIMVSDRYEQWSAEKRNAAVTSLLAPEPAHPKTLSDVPPPQILPQPAQLPATQEAPKSDGQ